MVEHENTTPTLEHSQAADPQKTPRIRPGLLSGGVDYAHRDIALQLPVQTLPKRL